MFCQALWKSFNSDSEMDEAFWPTLNTRTTFQAIAKRRNVKDAMQAQLTTAHSLVLVLTYLLTCRDADKTVFSRRVGLCGVTWTVSLNVFTVK